jgi:hypothetical protein
MHRPLTTKPKNTMRSRHLKVKPARTALQLRHQAKTTEEYSSQSLYQLALLQRRKNYHRHYLDVLKKRQQAVELELGSLDVRITQVAKQASQVVTQMSTPGSSAKATRVDEKPVTKVKLKY